MDDVGTDPTQYLDKAPKRPQVAKGGDAPRHLDRVDLRARPRCESVEFFPRGRNGVYFTALVQRICHLPIEKAQRLRDCANMH